MVDIDGYCAYPTCAYHVFLRYREGHGISMAEHFERLKENNWTHKEFQAGFREGVAPKDLSENFLKYEALLRRELAKGEVCRSMCTRRCDLSNTTINMKLSVTGMVLH